jgi:hypothetical protein
LTQTPARRSIAARRPAPITPIEWPRADPAALAGFDPRTKVCTMNCGPSTDDPRSDAERQLLCTDCLPRLAAGRA